jgi:hypothetical protein
MIGYMWDRPIEPTVCCLKHKCGMVKTKALVYCERCFGENTAEHYMETLILRAQWGMMREPMGRAA